MPVISPHDIILEKQFDRTPSPRPLPDRKSADYFVNMFFQYVNFSVPMLHEPTLRAKLDCLYSETTLEDDGINVDRQLDKFFVNMVFSVGLLAVHKQDSPRIPIALCEQYCQTALLALEAVPFPRTVEGVQALTLLAQYSYLHPAEYGGWNTIGMALQLAVELGLHQDPCSEDLDCLTLDMMRRSFWAAYSMDRSAAIAIGRPKYLSDGFITAKYPSDADDEYITTGSATQPEGIPRGKKRYCIHWLRYRQLQSEIHTVLYERMPSLYSQVDYARWQNTMAEEIRSWYNAVLQESRPSEIGSSNIAPPEILELAFQLALMLIYRPSPNNPAPSDPALSALATCSMEVNQLYKRFFRENKVRFYWHAVENVFNAGTSLIYAYAHSAAVREQYSRRSLDAAIHSTSSVLWAMVEHFPAFKGRRDAFEVIASKTLADFGEHNATEGSSLASHASFPPANVEYRDGKMTMSHSNNKAGLGASQVDEESDSPRHNNPFGTGRILLGDEEEASYLALPVNMGGPDMHSSDLSMLNAEAFDIDENLDFDKVSTNWDEMTYATWL
ncbi:unnamed protein product [Clonostachys rosea f. rosea IK726]|uniref:Uncharacterized protein n=2 Tax=Bionectria ochroleuca TaxID=29856 RepID=A0ACA9U372_BIOOC|nr:unnamed protein product [Clonostachys rosea f. rosea IK726]